VVAFARRGHIDLERFALPALAAFVGSGVSALILTWIDPRFLSALLPLLLLAMIVYFIVSPRMTKEGRHSRDGPVLLVAISLIIGAYAGFCGPGTGSFITTALVALFGLGLTRAVAHTKLLNFADNLAGLAVLMMGGRVLWMTGIATALASVASGQVGAHVAMRFEAGAARPLLIIMSLALTTKLLADPANPLTATVAQWLS